MTDRMLQGLKVLLVGLALVTICAAEDLRPATDLGPESMDQRPAILQQAPGRVLLTGRAEALSNGAISRDDFDGLERTLTDYQGAFESMSLSGIQRVWPGIDRRREKAFRGVFKYMQGTSSSPRLDLQCTAPAVANLKAAIECREAVTYRQKNLHFTTVGPVRISILLKKESNLWFVEKMKGL